MLRSSDLRVVEAVGIYTVDDRYYGATVHTGEGLDHAALASSELDVKPVVHTVGQIREAGPLGEAISSWQESEGSDRCTVGLARHVFRIGVTPLVGVVGSNQPLQMIPQRSRRSQLLGEFVVPD